MSHTPGPWRVKRRWSNNCEIVPRITCNPDDDRACGWIADIIGAPYLGHESTLPNAMLIAAAPDLLAACRHFVEVYRRSAQLEKCDLACIEAEAAIEKATKPADGER